MAAEREVEYEVFHGARRVAGPFTRVADPDCDMTAQETARATLDAQRYDRGIWQYCTVVIRTGLFGSREVRVA